MISKIARKEFTEMWRDGRFRWTAVIVFALLLTALALGWKNYAAVRRDQTAAQNQSRETWENQGSRNPHSAAHFGVYAFKPKMPLSLVDTGIDNFIGSSIWVEAHFQNPSRNRPVEDATALQRFGELTAAGVLQLLLPLVIIFLAFDAFAGERVNGTLRQVLSLGVSRASLVFGKTLGRLAAILMLLIPATIIGVLALALSSGGDVLLASLPRFLLMCAGYLLYFGAFIGVALTVSALSNTPRTALIGLLAFWIFGCLLVPRLANDAAENVFPVPTGEEFWAGVERDQKDGVDGHNPANLRTKELEREILAQYNVAKVEDLPVNFNGISLQAGEENSNPIFDKHFGAIWQTHFAQERVQNLFGIIAPFVAMRSFSAGMAGTDLAHGQNFADAVEQYRRGFVKMLNDDFANHSKTTDDYNYFVDSEVWEKSPQFAYVAPDTSWALSRQIWNLALLLAWCAGAIGASVFTAIKMKAD